MSTFFAQTGSISLLELHILLNDLFISELNDYIRCDCEGITGMVVDEYQKTTNKINKSKVIRDKAE